MTLLHARPFFCESASALVTPILYQHLTDLILRKLVRERYEIMFN